MVYIKCEICNYVSCDKSNYNKHIKTKKHKDAVKARESVITKAKCKNVTKHVNKVQQQLSLLCKYCGKAWREGMSSITGFCYKDIECEHIWE